MSYRRAAAILGKWPKDTGFTREGSSLGEKLRAAVEAKSNFSSSQLSAWERLSNDHHLESNPRLHQSATASGLTREELKAGIDMLMVEEERQQ